MPNFIFNNNFLQVGDKGFVYGNRFISYGKTKQSTLVYGIQYDFNPITNSFYDDRASDYSSPKCKRIILNKNNQIQYVDEFPELPAHNFRRCVIQNLKTRQVKYYLDKNDSSKKINGQPSILTGEDGDVMVQIPITYYRSQQIDYQYDGKTYKKYQWLVSLVPFEGSKPHPFFYTSPDGKTVRKQYVGAFQSTICDELGISLNNDQSKSSSSSYQEGYRARSISNCKLWNTSGDTDQLELCCENIRKANQNNLGNNVNFWFYKYIAIMMYIQGATFQTKDFISKGVNKPSYKNIKNNGLTISLGNNTGQIKEGDTILSFSYRGLQNIYGNCMKYVQGFIALSGNTQQVFYTQNTSVYGFYNAYNSITHNFPQVWPSGDSGSNYIVDFDKDTFLPLNIKSSYGYRYVLTDYYYRNDSQFSNTRKYNYVMFVSYGDENQYGISSISFYHYFPNYIISTRINC